MTELEYSYEHDGPERAIYARGHWDKEQFFTEADQKLQEDFEGMSMDELCLEAHNVEHLWWKEEPTEDGEFIEFVRTASNEPGAYSVTVIEIN